MRSMQTRAPSILDNDGNTTRRKTMQCRRTCNTHLMQACKLDEGKASTDASRFSIREAVLQEVSHSGPWCQSRSHAVPPPHTRYPNCHHLHPQGRRRLLLQVQPLLTVNTASNLRHLLSRHEHGDERVEEQKGLMTVQQWMHQQLASRGLGCHQ